MLTTAKRKKKNLVEISHILICGMAVNFTILLIIIIK